MTKETRTPEPLYYMDLCQGAFLIEIDDPAGFRLGRSRRHGDRSTFRFASILYSQLGLRRRVALYEDMERVRQIARSWKTLDQLSPADAEIVAGAIAEGIARGRRRRIGDGAGAPRSVSMEQVASNCRPLPFEPIRGRLREAPLQLVSVQSRHPLVDVARELVRRAEVTSREHAIAALDDFGLTKRSKLHSIGGRWSSTPGL